MAGAVFGEVSAHPHEMQFRPERERFRNFTHREIEEFADSLGTVHEVEHGFDPFLEFERSTEGFDFRFQLDTPEQVFPGVRIFPGIGGKSVRSGIHGIHAC